MKTLTSLKEMATSAKDLADKATEGPWSLTSDLPSYAVSAEKFDVVSTLNRKYRSGPKNFGSYENDAEFIASARTTVPELSAAVVLLCNEVEALMEQLENIRESLASVFGYAKG